MRVKELTAHQCFTQHSLRRIYVQPPAVTTTTAPAPAAITTTDETRAAPNETAHSAAPNVDRRRQQPYNQHQQQHHQQRETLLPLRCADSQPHHLTDRKYVAKPVVQRQPLQTLAESPAHAVATVTEKTVSCRLYDCILPATCTTRNASSEPPSVLKLDLHQQQQQRLHSVAGTNSNTNSIGRSAQLSKKKFLLEVMDRSVDSIGSCSLDVDAESTDFSGIEAAALRTCRFYFGAVFAGPHWGFLFGQLFGLMAARSHKYITHAHIIELRSIDWVIVVFCCPFVAKKQS